MLSMEIDASALRDLQERLSRLRPAAAEKVFREATIRALAPTVVAARKRAPAETGRLRGAIRLWVSGLGWPQRLRAGIWVKERVEPRHVYVRRRSGRGRPWRWKLEFMPPSAYGWWVEAGHGIGKRSRAVVRAQRWARKTGRTIPGVDTRRQVEARPFMEPAWRATSTDLIQRWGDLMRQWIDGVCGGAV